MARDTKSNGAKVSDEKDVAKTQFSRILKRKTALAGFDIDGILDAINERGVVRMTKDRMKLLRSTGYENPEDCQKPQELAEIAAVLNCTIEDLFGITDAPSKTQIATADPDITKIKEALSGPRKEFLLDAIDLAYQAYLSTVSNYRR